MRPQTIIECLKSQQNKATWGRLTNKARQTPVDCKQMLKIAWDEDALVPLKPGFRRLYWYADGKEIAIEYSPLQQIQIEGFRHEDMGV